MVEVVVKPKKEKEVKEEVRQELKEFNAKMDAMQEVQPYIADLLKVKDLIGDCAESAGMKHSYLLKWTFDQFNFFETYDQEDDTDEDDGQYDDDDDTAGDPV